MRKFALTAASVLTLAATTVPAAASPPANPGNPSATGIGQPGVAFSGGADCSTTTTSPNGFNSGGFTNTATGVYANPIPAQSGISSGNKHAVSEYDVACYQFSQTR